MSSRSAPGSVLRTAEKYLHYKKAYLSVNCYEGDLFTLQHEWRSSATPHTHDLNQCGTEQEPLSPVGPSGPRVCTQTDFSPSPAPLKRRYLVP